MRVRKFFTLLKKPKFLEVNRNLSTGFSGLLRKEYSDVPSPVWEDSRNLVECYLAA